MCALLLPAGCAVAPLPALPDTTPPTWRHDGDDGSAPAVDLRNWWTAFHDPELDRLVEAALADNLTIAQSALRIEAARAIDARSGAGFLPQFGFRTYAEPAPDSSASYFQAGFDSKWEFGLFGRAQSQQRIAAADRGIAESEGMAARASVVAEVARAYVELRGAEQRLALLGHQLDAAREKTRLVATRERLRLASSLDLAHARADEQSAAAALAEPRVAIERCRQRIAVLLARDGSGDDLVAAGAPPQLGDLRVATAPAELLRTRPEIRRAENDVLKAAGEAGIARADLLPRLGLGGALTYSARVIGHTRLSDADGIVTFGPAIDIPLFDWGARRAALDARTAELSASLLAYRQAVLEGVAEAQTAMATLDGQRERVLALAQSLDASKQGADSAATLRRLGLADGVDGAAADSAVLQSQLDLAQAEQDRSIAFIALYKALGGAALPPERSVQ